MMMIYHAANTLDANMIKGLLAQYDIPAFIQDEYLQGGAGELPAADLVTVSVNNEHQQLAKKIIAQWETAVIIDDALDEEAPDTNLLDDGLNVAS